MLDDTVAPRVLAVAQSMLAGGLVVGSAGNVSGRAPGDRVVWLTPAALTYDTMTLDDLVAVDLDGVVQSGTRAPTSELALHLECYRRHPEIGGVVHAHAPNASMYALARRPVPPVLEEAVLHLGDGVPCTPYRPTGSGPLAEAAASGLGERSAVLLANHGLVAVGPTVDGALHAAQVAEHAAEVARGAHVLGGAVPLADDALDDLRARYRATRRSWGQQPA